MEDIENGMIIDELWEKKPSMSDEEYNEYLEFQDQLLDEERGK